MLIVISPAKTLDFSSPVKIKKHTQPQFMKESSILIELLKKQSPAELQSLMSISDKLSLLNAERYDRWHTPFTVENAKPAVFAFQGDVYTGLDAANLNTDAITFLQQHLRILSGLYGLLLPLDLMQAYRLEMGTRLNNEQGTNLYKFWGNKITDAINLSLKNETTPVLINLASNEYFKSINSKDLHAEVITPVFKDFKNGQYKVISFLAKKARGSMVNFIARKQITSPEDIKKFKDNGYAYQADLSNKTKWVFTRNMEE